MTTLARLKRKARRVAKRTPLLRGALRRYDKARRPAVRPAAKPAAKSATKSAKNQPAEKKVDFGDLVAVLAGVRWLDPVTCELTGWAYGSKVAASINPPALKVWLAGTDGEKIMTKVERRTDHRANTTAADGRMDRIGSGIRAVLELTTVAAGSNAEFQVRCALSRGSSRIEGPFNKRIGSGSVGSLIPSARSARAGNGVGHFAIAWSDDRGLTITRAAGEPPKPKTAPIMIDEWAVINPSAPRIAAAGWVAEDIDPDELDFELRGPQGAVTGTVEWTRRGFRLDLPLQASFWNGPVAPLSSGSYRLWVGTNTKSHTVRLAPETTSDLPVEFESTRLNATLCRAGADVPAVQIGAPLRADEAGPYAFAQQQRRYRTTPSIRDGSVYFESFVARSAGDSPRAIHEELVRRGTDRTLYWTVADYSVQLPEGATPLLWRSREWFEVLGKASYFVHNCGAPIPLRQHKRPGQVVVQTWHGTPFKLLGNDRPVNQRRANYKRDQKALCSDWDYLLAQNSYTADIFRRAYFYQGNLLELGYPRNDDVVNTSPDEVARLRANLGIPADKKVILYAPTWRDGEGHIVGYLDLEWLGRQLGDDYFFLLRGHYNSIRPGSRVYGTNIIDATSYPVLNDLMLVADIMITDYSSVMFDYPVTGKPIQFFVPDYEDYRDRRRGLYFDLTTCAPGPVAFNREDLVESVRSADRLHAEHATAYAEWVAKFSPRDDGKASARVVDTVFGGS